jgi:hypothetical protein
VAAALMGGGRQNGFLLRRLIEARLSMEVSVNKSETAKRGNLNLRRMKMVISDCFF